MKTIRVNTSDSYDVIIGRGIIERCGELIKGVANPSKIAIITDDIVDDLYGDKVKKSIENAGFIACKFKFLNGESSKNIKVLSDIYDFLASENITRLDIIVALGGGVTGDIAGFAAATYLRGIDFIQIPTTLLAQVDSSVGGKTAIDITAGKNLVGAFKQPKLVICDVDILKTLSEDIFIDGMGEVVKYGMIKSATLFDNLANLNLDTIMPEIDDIIAECVDIKRQVVENDEFDTGERMLLNFGHTLGHSIEKYYNFTGISHGKAVAVGMIMITKIAEKNGLCKDGLADKLSKCLGNYNLNIHIKPTISQLAEATLNDKKRAGGNISIIICKDCGESEIRKMQVTDYLSLLK